jgi:site-specific recombinase XerD
MNLKRASQDFLSGYFSTHERSAKTRAAYATDLSQFWRFAGEDLEIGSLGGTLIECWAAQLKSEGYSPATLRRKVAAVKVFCSYWVRKGELKESPFWRVKISIGRIQQLPRSLTEHETRALLAQARQQCAAGASYPKGEVETRRGKLTSAHYRASRDLALVELLFATGMRVGEASGLDIEDYFQDGAFTVKGKGGRTRLAFVVDADGLQIQKDHLAARVAVETDSRALFLNVFGKRLSTQGMARTIARLRAKAGVERHVTPHMLRHTVATMLLRNGADVRIVQEFLGHASIATTQRYTYITKEHLVSALKKYHPSASLRSAS